LAIIKIETKDEKTKILIKQWSQLKILEETKTYISFSGYDQLTGLVLLELYHRSKRHPEIKYKIKYLEEVKN